MSYEPDCHNHSSYWQLKENKNKLSANQTVLLNEIDIATIRLNRQVENLLNMSRLETGMLKIKRDCVIAMKLFMLQFKKIAPIKKQSHYRFYTKW
jgi:two-component system sensor histidine kinase KdpD